MEIDVGSRVIAEFSRNDRVQCLYVGMLAPEFLIIKTPMTPGIRDRFAEGLFVQFRCLKEGKILSFGAEVLRYQASPASLVFISYPKDMSEYNLRKEGRIECHFPTEFNLDGAKVSGHIEDISPGGCRFVCKGKRLPKTHEKAVVNGHFTTLESERRYEFTGVIMAQQISGGVQSVGIKFRDADLPDGVRARLAHIEEMQEVEKASA